MEHFKKAICVIDTSSIINLDQILLAKRDILYYIRRFFDVHVCNIIREELDRHQGLVASREVTYWPRFLSSVRYAPIVLTDDGSVIGPFYTTPPIVFGADGAGERGNARVALELLLNREAGHAVFVTDDEKASNQFLHSMRQAFPGLDLWTSSDVILYLGAVLLREGRTTYDDVRAALRDVFAARGRAKSYEERTDAERSAIIKKYSASVNDLRLVKRITAHWRI